MTLQDEQVTVIDAATSGLLVPEKAPPPPKGEEALRELRLALVCYGGVSLAIYMHGITKELQKAVQASAALEANPDANPEENPFEPDDTAHVYWNVLREQSQRNQVRTRVVIDIISGTSAGGINGVFLAAGLARNQPQDALRDLWMDRGDIKKLLAGPSWLPAFAKVPLILGAALRRLKIEPPLRGGEMCKWLNEAFESMKDPSGHSPTEPRSLIPDHQRLQLFVPVTDFSGYDVRVPLDDPAWVQERRHRHVLRFVHDGSQWQQLSPDWNDALAFAARATSSFPGAFPPISIKDYERYVEGHQLAEDMQEILFPSHVLAGVSLHESHFIDGGVLDNKPFETTISAIKLRPSSSEVDRRLLYIEPDPSTEVGDLPRGQEPSWFGAVFAGFAGIPRKEPIVDDLESLAQHNVNVGRIRDIIETSFKAIRRRVLRGTGSPGDSISGEIDANQVAEWRTTFGELALTEAGFSAATYLRLRISAVVDDFAALIAQRRNYPPASSHALFVRSVVRQWVNEQQLFEKKPSFTPEQREFLVSLDLGYHDRHLRFLIAALSWWYDPKGAKGIPSREQLDFAKHRLYARLDELQAVATALTEDAALSELVSRVFSKEAIDASLKDPARDVASRHKKTLAELESNVRELVGERLQSLAEGIDAEIIELTKPWTDFARTEMLTRHLGFPFWDVLVYPVASLSGVNERDHVEVMRISPQEAKALYPDAKKKRLKGRTLGHFGAFFSREGRENDYLWGRLDGAERIIALLRTEPGMSVGAPPPDSKAEADLRTACKPAFDAILSSERQPLQCFAKTEEFKQLEDRVKSM